MNTSYATESKPVFVKSMPVKYRTRSQEQGLSVVRKFEEHAFASSEGGQCCCDCLMGFILDLLEYCHIGWLGQISSEEARGALDAC